MLSPGVAKILLMCLFQAAVCCVKHMWFFGQNRHRDNNLPGEIPTWFLNLSNAEAVGPVALKSPRTDFVAVPDSVVVWKRASPHLSQEPTGIRMM